MWAFCSQLFLWIASSGPASCAPSYSNRGSLWEVLNGVGVDGVGGIFPFFSFFFGFLRFFVFFSFSLFFSFFFAFLSFFFAFLRFSSFFFSFFFAFSSFFVFFCFSSLFRLFSFFFVPKGPCRTKNSTASKFGMGRKNRYGNSKNATESLRSACFCRERRHENGTESEKTTAVAKYYGFERRTIFSTEGSFGFFFVFLRFSSFFFVFFLFSWNKGNRLQFTGKMGNFTPTPSAPTPFGTSRSLLGH